MLLDKVKKFWIEGVLAKSLHMQVLIELGLEERGEFVPAPMSGVEEFLSESRQSFPAGTAATDIFEGIGAGRTLLILGEPGAGKTVTLLKLAESLITRTENDLSQPLPVVINLSSWGNKRQSIADWLVQELYGIYGTSKSLGKTWVEQEQLLLLLDGLDEVDAKYRNDCVRALKQFIRNHGLTEMVVCCRIREYKSLSERLRLRSAIYIQPLTLEQIDQYMEQAGEQLTVLREVLNQNADLKTFASSPLILSIMSLAYQDCSWDTFQTITTADTFHQRLFDVYINRMLTRRGTTQQYSQEQTKRWLIWIAQRMAQASQTVFFIERLQPSWLQTWAQKIRYRLESALIVGLISGLISGLLEGLIYGLFEGLIEGVIFGLSVGLFIGLIAGVVSGSLGDIKVVETLKWSWQEVKKGFYFRLTVGLIAGLIVGLIAGLYFWLIEGVIAELSSWLIIGLIAGLIFGLIFGLTGGLRGREIQKIDKPNQGIWKSARRALNFTLGFWLFGGLSDVLIEGLKSTELMGTVSFGLALGLINGGTTCIRHFALRLMFWRMGCIPWNYARFLDYAADRLFLQKVGGGYIFVHRMLMEHFAKMELEQRQH